MGVLSKIANISNSVCITKQVDVADVVMGTPPMESAVRTVEEVAEAVGRPVEGLPPLSRSINPDALNGLITGNRSHDVTVTFAYAGARVLVHSDGTIYVRPLESGTTAPP